MDARIPEYILPVEDEVLAFTHSKRSFIVNEMLKKGIPEDPAYTKIILNALDGMDKSALTRKRIRVDERQNNNQEQAAALIAKLLVASSGPKQLEEFTRTIIPILSSDIPDPIAVEGETSNSASAQTYDSFIASLPSED